MNVLILRRLQERAKAEAGLALERISVLTKKLESVLREEADILDQIAFEEGASERATAYRPIKNNSYQCPCCAIVEHIPSELTELHSGNDKPHLHCTHCGATFEFG